MNARKSPNMKFYGWSSIVDNEGNEKIVVHLRVDGHYFRFDLHADGNHNVNAFESEIALVADLNDLNLTINASQELESAEFGKPDKSEMH